MFCMQVFFFSIVWYKYNIKSNCLIVLSRLFPVVWVWWKNYFLPIILINKSFNFWYFLRIFFSMFWWFNATVKAYWKHISSLFLGFIVAYCCFLLFFSTIQENLYMIHLFSNLFFFGGGNTINQYYQEQTHFLSLILLNLFDHFVKEIQKVFLNFISFVTHHNFYVMALSMHSTSFFRIFKRNKIDLHC